MENIDVEQLINLVEACPALWDKQDAAFKDKQVKINCWRAVCLSLNQDFDKLKEKQRQEYGKLVQRKWTGIRDTWVRKRKYQYKEKSSGSGAKKTRPYIFEQQLSFLRKVYSECPNVVVSIISDEEGDSLEKSTTPDDLSSKVQKPSNERERKLPMRYELDHKMVQLIDHQLSSPSNEKNRHLDFFKGLLPSVNMFDDDQTLEFQGGVIALIQRIKKEKTINQF